MTTETERKNTRLRDKKNTLELRLSPLDNVCLANLCGALDENLRQIETAFNVTLTRRGEHFTLRGDPERLSRASEALQKFYAQAKKTLTIDEIQLGLVEINASSTEKNTSLDSAVPPLITRKSRLYGRTPHQTDYLLKIREHDITFGIGPAGTGKTYLAVASAVDAFERETVQRIILTRPAVEAGERLGFLPGDLSKKIDPYLKPLYDALYDLMGYDRVSRLFERGMIEIAPLAYMRGRTLNHAFVILDEAQNTTREQMKMFLTRIGIGAKAVVDGDITQIDLPDGQKSGLLEARRILKDVRGIAFTEFGKEDVVRHPLVARIISAYETEAGARRRP